LDPREASLPDKDQPIVIRATHDPRHPKPGTSHWWPTLGPLFYYDLVTATRRGQHSLLRCAAASALLLTLLVGYASHVRGFNPLHPFAELTLMDPREPQEFATWFMFACLTVQVIGVFLVSPMVIADAIARDRETRMLEFLFVTELSDWEIVAGKLFSRLAYLVGALLAGLPVLALTQLFGGVDLMELAMGYAGLLSCLFVVGTLAMSCSISAPTVVAATAIAYGSAISYGLFFTCCITGGIYSLSTHWSAVMIVVGINLALGLTLLAGCVSQLRPRSQRHARPSGKTVQIRVRRAPKPPPRSARHPQHPLPPVYDDYPLLWKELNQYVAAWRPDSVRTACFAALVLPIVAAIFLGVLLMFSEPTRAATVSATIERALDTLRSIARTIVTVLTVLLGCLMGVVALRHATASVVREREQKTLESLLTLPVERSEILAAKWLGGFAGWCPVLISLWAVVEFGAVTGAISPASTLILLCSIAAPLSFLASLGLWISTASRTTLRANITSILCVLIMIAAPILIASAVEASQELRGYRNHLPNWIVTAGLPPLAWVRIIFPGYPDNNGPSLAETTAILTGAAAYALAGRFFWHAARGRLRS
jgi:ABC-type transport system involved in multi-copper enzyme maturation permease subunit